MRALLLPAIPILGLMLAAGDAESRPSFYYAFSEKNQLHLNPKKIFLKYRGATDNPSSIVVGVKGKIPSQGRILSFRKTAPFQGMLSGQRDFSAAEKADITALPEVESAMDVLETQEGTEMSYQDEICLKFKKSVPLSERNRVLQALGISIKQETEFIVGQVRSDEDALDVANKLFETGKLEYSHPDFYIPIVLNQIPNDTYFGWQWNFRNVGQVINEGHTGTPGADIKAVDAWRAARGRNVLVAVLDQGVTNNHPDLPNTRQVRLIGSNFSGGDANNPSPVGDQNHGNACAGLVAAEMNNNLGTVGIAPRARIMPISMIGASTASVASAIDFARNNGAQVLSNSWGYDSNNPNLVPAIVDALNRALTLGRGGLGCVVVYAAGNTAHRINGNNGYISFPANVPGVITVGASDRFDAQSNYSPTSPAIGKQIDIVAPSHRAYSSQIAMEDLEIWTIDIPGTPGYNPRKPSGEQLPTSASHPSWSDYTGRMGGTSAACPQVAGVAAMILGFKPGLRQQEVFNVLTSTADKVGGYTYTNGRSAQLGFGRLNAVRAVRMALPSTPLIGLAMR